MKIFALVAALFLTPAVAMAEDCFLCGADSTDGCDGAKQCRGTRDHCRDIGCKISGTASCSEAANVKICSSATEGFTLQASFVQYQTPRRTVR